MNRQQYEAVIKQKTANFTVQELKTHLTHINKLPRTDGLDVLFETLFEDLSNKATEQDFISFCETLN